MAIQRFEEMKVWQDARVLTKNIYSLTKNKYFIKDFWLARSNPKSNSFYYVKHC